MDAKEEEASLSRRQKSGCQNLGKRGRRAESGTGRARQATVDHNLVWTEKTARRPDLESSPHTEMMSEMMVANYPDLTFTHCIYLSKHHTI